MKKRTLATASVTMGAVLALTLGSPALALGTKDNGTIEGSSWTVSQKPCDQTCAFTASDVGRITLTVQLTEGGNLVSGTKVTATGSPATYQTYSSFYLPGGRHTGGGTTINT